MITSLLLSTLFLSAPEQVITRRPLDGPPSTDFRPPDWVEAIEPDVVLRGRPARLVVAGKDLEALKTIRIEPADGVRISAVTPLAPRGDAEVVAVDLVIAATAQPGERQVVLLVKPEIAGVTATRPGTDSELQRQIDKMFEEFAKEREQVEGGSIYINSHDIVVAGVSVAGDRVRVALTDAAGDFQTSVEPVRPRSSDELIVIRVGDDPLRSEARCGNQIFHGLLIAPEVTEQKGSSAVITATLGMAPTQGTCELRVRARDREGNTSQWFTTKINLR